MSHTTEAILLRQRLIQTGVKLHDTDIHTPDHLIMEVISLNERDRSATILNTAPPSDDYDDVTLDVVVGQEADDFVAPNEFINDDDEAAAVANNEGGGTWNKNKLLLSIIAGTAMLCAVAAGGGVAAHNARMAASTANNCPTATIRPPPAAIGSAKMTPKSGGRRNLDEDETIITTGGAHYRDIPKTIEDKRKNRMLAERLGHKAASFAWLDYYLDGLKFVFTNGNKQQQQQNVRRLQTTPKSLKATTDGSVQVSFAA